MHWVAKPDTSQPRSRCASRPLGAKELQAIPGVRNFGSHIGQAFLADEPYGIHFGENWISIDESADYDKTLAAVQEVVDGYPGLRRDVQTYLKERIREVLTGSSETIVVHIFGDDLDTLETTADDVQEHDREDRRRRRGERRAPDRGAPGRGHGRSSTRPSATGSSRATSGGRRPPS